MSKLKRTCINWWKKFLTCNNYGFDSEKYWKCRKIAMSHGEYSYYRQAVALHYINKINMRFNSRIYTEIGGGAQFKSNPILPHQLSGIFIASTVRIGENVTILQQVTIGGNPKSFDGKSPISQAACIGDNVIIGAGAKIIGDVKIGNNVSVGANAVVVTDIPDNCIAVGIPAIVKRKKGYGNDRE